MTTIQNRSFLAFAFVLFTALSSCTVPTTGVTAPGSAKVTLQAHQARLVFQVGQARSLSRALTDAGYLTVEMRSVADGTVKADDAARETDGSYQVDIDGLVAGDWKLKVRLYADINSATLLYYADVVHYVAVGTPTSIALQVYQPSSLTGGTITLADKVESLEVEGRGQPWGDSLGVNGVQNLVPGEVVQLHALPWSTSGPATDDRVTFTTDDPDVVEFAANGRLKARGVGETTIRITTVEGRKTAAIPVKVEEAIVGVWESGSPRNSLLVVQRSLAGLEARLLVGLASGSLTLDHKRGLVSKQNDGTFQAVLPQNLQPNANRTALVWGPNTNNTEFYNLYPLPDGKLAVNVTNGDQMTLTRVPSYLPVASLVHNPVTPASFTVLSHQDWSVPGNPWDILNAASGAPTVGNLYWWVQDSNIGDVDPLTGVIKLIGFGPTTIRAASVDNPELGTLAWSLTADPVAPSLTESDLAIVVPPGYVTNIPSGDIHVLNLRIRVAYDPTVYRYLSIQRWDSNTSTWVGGLTDLQANAQGDWFDNYFSVTPGTEEKFRVITKASATTGITNDSAPSPVVTGYAPDANGMPILWESANVVPGLTGSTDLYNGFTVPVYTAPNSDQYRSRWFVSLDGTNWYSHVMYSLRWGEQVWWIYSDPVGEAFDSTWVVGRKVTGEYLDAFQVNGLTRVRSIDTAIGNGRVRLDGESVSQGTLQWNPSLPGFEEYNP